MNSSHSRRPRLAIDCRYVRPGAHDGISRFTAGIAHALARVHDIELLISDEDQLAHLPHARWHRISDPTSWKEPFVSRQINRIGVDVVFSPMQTMGSLGRRYRLLLTVHDLIYYSHRTPPRDLPAFVRLLWRLYHLAWWPQRLLLNGSDAVVTVSETTRQLIAEHKLTRRPVFVVKNAADSLPLLAQRKTPRQPPVLVYMGSFMPYKNVETLVRGLHFLPGTELHFMSSASPEMQRRLTVMAPDGALVFHDGVSDDQYIDFLDRATALVSASLAEGFGIPLVEAARRATPVVVSDIPIFREIGGDSALYFDPNSPEDFVNKVSQLSYSVEWHKRSKASASNSERFSWSSSAESLWNAVETTYAEKAAGA